jgi:hypothetical protein
MKISYVLAVQLWIGIGLIIPIGMTIYGGQSGYMPGIIFSIVVVNIFLMIVSFLLRNEEYESKQQIIPPGRAAIISFFTWNFFAAYIIFGEGILDVTVLFIWVVGCVISYFLPLLLLWIHGLIKDKVR